MVDQHWIRAGAITVGGVVAVIGTFLPWLRSGAVDRSSYEIFELVERLGFTPGGPVDWTLRAWPTVPLLFVGAATVQWNMSVHPIAVWARRLLPIAAGLYAGGVAVVLQLAPDAGLVRFRYGTLVTGIGAIVVLVASLWPVRTRGSAASGDA